jgi:hypothetical protein
MHTSPHCSQSLLLVLHALVSPVVCARVKQPTLLLRRPCCSLPTSTRSNRLSVHAARRQQRRRHGVQLEWHQTAPESRVQHCWRPPESIRPLVCSLQWRWCASDAWQAAEQQSDVVPCSRMRLDAARAMRVGLHSIALAAGARCIACARTTTNHHREQL